MRPRKNIARRIRGNTTHISERIRLNADGEIIVSYCFYLIIFHVTSRMARNGLDELYKILYKLQMNFFKHVEFRGSALDDLRAFPVLARREAGYQLDQVQQGGEADDWKPMNTVGAGVREIRIRDEAGAFRVIYVAKFARALYVLHCFQKKTQQTSKSDIDLAAKRYRDLRKELEQ